METGGRILDNLSLKPSRGRTENFVTRKDVEGPRITVVQREGHAEFVAETVRHLERGVRVARGKDMIDGCSTVHILSLSDCRVDPPEVLLVDTGQSAAHPVGPASHLPIEDIPEERDIGPESPNVVNGNRGRRPATRKRHPSDLDTFRDLGEQRQIGRSDLLIQEALVDRHDRNFPPCLDERSTNGKRPVHTGGSGGRIPEREKEQPATATHRSAIVRSSWAVSVPSAWNFKYASDTSPMSPCIRTWP